MGSYSDMMNDVVHVAPPGTADDYGHAGADFDNQVPIRCRVEENIPVDRSSDGKTIPTKDVIATHGQRDDSPAEYVRPDESWYIWLEGADTSEESDALRPTNVASAKPIDGGRRLFEVTL